MNDLAADIAVIAAEEVRRLVHDASDLIASGTTSVLEPIERLTQQVVAGIGLAVIAGVIDLASTGDTTVSCPGGGDGPKHRVRRVDRRSKTVRSLLGTFELGRDYFYCGECRAGCVPLDTLLGVQATGLSPGLVRACALAGAEMPYAKARAFIHTVTGLDLASTSTLARATRAQGRRARDLITAEQARAVPGVVAGVNDDGPDRCYVILDGTGAPMLPRECEGRAGKEKPRAGTREVKIGCLFTQSGTDPATGQPVWDEGSASYVATFQPSSEFGPQVLAEFHRRGFDQIRQPVVIGDGAKWIWRIADEKFPQATQIVDYFHAREHLRDLVKLMTERLDDVESFEKELVVLLDLGDTAGITTAVVGIDVGDDQVRAGIAREVNYFVGNHHRMQYATFIANGYFIGSGAVESACGSIVKARAKGPGLHWTVRGLDPVIALRTLHQSGRDGLLWPTPQT